MMRRASCLVTLVFAVLSSGDVFAQDNESAPLNLDRLSSEIEAILDDETLEPLARIRSLRELIADEEIAVARKVCVQWIEQLADPKFNRRAEAEAKITKLGPPVIDLIEAGAADQDVERATRCLGILIQYAEGDDEEVTKLALEAIERISKRDDSPVREGAGKQFRLLSMSDIERAINAMESAGAKLYRTKDGDVRSITVFRGGFGDQEMSQLKYFPRVSRMSIRGPGVTDAGLTYLADLKALTSLTISDSSITDFGLETISKLEGLDRVSLGSGKYTDRGLEILQTMQLRSLMLMRYELTPRTVEILEGWQDLQSLSLIVKDVTDEELSMMSGLSNLGFLSIDESPMLSDEGIAHLKSLPLRSLTIGECKISDEGLSHLGEIHGLSSLNLNSDSITDEGLEHLKELSSLTMLYIGGTEISDAGLAHLANLNGLRYLTIRKGKFTDQCIEDLKEIKQLTHLNLIESEISDEAVKRIREALPKVSVQH